MKHIVLILSLCVQRFAISAQNTFNTYFEEKSLRIDFALSGNVDKQQAALQQLREEPIWGGPVKNLLEMFDYGGYNVKVFAKDNSQLIYSRSFNTLFEEWRTTEQAKYETQSWTNSISIPYPKKEIKVVISGRNRDDMKFSPLLEINVDPASIFIDRSELEDNNVIQVQYSGNISEKVDLVFLAEGYTDSEQDKFKEDVEKFTESLFKTPPFDIRRSDFNVWAVNLLSKDSGTDLSGKGIFKHTPLNSGYYTFGIDRYLTTQDMKSVRDAVWNVPCDAIYILVNTDTYGGGGMYNLYAIGTAGHELTPKIFVHELGHSFAGLADEYFSPSVAYDDNFYNINVEPWEPNITTLVNFQHKWKDLLEQGTPIPTLADEASDKTGVYEGGGYLEKGIFRPKNHCMMRDYAPFCPVCSRAIMRMVNFLCDKEQ
jgi:hypothetical protein